MLLCLTDSKGTIKLKQLEVTLGPHTALRQEHA